MSLHVLTWVMDHSPAQGTDRLVLYSLAHHAANREGEGAFPSVPTLVRETRMSKRAVQYALQSLAEGEVGRAIEQTGWTKNGCQVWRVCMDEAATKFAAKKRPPSRARAQAGGATVAPPAEVAPQGRNLRHEGVQPTTSTGATVAPEPFNGSEGIPEPTSRALAHARAQDGGGGTVITIPRGATPRTRDRLTRTAERLGAELIHASTTTSTNGGTRAP